MRTEDGNSNGACCVFPFVYKSKSHTQCVEGSGSRTWCSTTSNFAEDDKWGYCKPANVPVKGKN